MSMPSLKFKRLLITIENKRNEHSQVAELVDAMWCGTRFVHHSLSGENKGKRCDHAGSNPVLTTKLKKMNTQETAQLMRTAKLQAFDNWMRNTVKSLHYANNEAMNNAYKRVNDEV